MKFAWKVFFCVLLTLILFFGLGSYLLISVSFDSALERAKETAVRENTLLCFSLATAAGTVSGGDEEISDKDIQGLASQLLASYQGMGLCVRDADMNRIFGGVPESEVREARVFSETERSLYVSGGEGMESVVVSTPVKAGGRTVLVESAHDISGLYSGRREQFAAYRRLSVLILAVSAVSVLGLSVLLTRPLRRLAATTQHIAAGNYGERARQKGSDEIAVFTRDFNAMADALEQRIGELEEGVRKRDEFVSNFTHELKTPLTSIIGYADMLRSRKLSEEEIFLSSDFIFKEGKRLEAIGTRLMDIIVLKNTELDAKPARAEELARDIAGAAAPSFLESGVGLTLDIEPGRVVCEPALLRTLVQNLLDNARKASRPGGKVILAGKKAGGGYAFAVKDFGGGMSPEVLAHIREPFYMADKSRSRAGGGAGLGLALCAEIAKLHGGILEFESEPGKGASAVLFLPGEDREEEGGHENR